MVEQQWEYCELKLYGWEEVKGKGNKYGVNVQYYAPDKSPYYSIADLNGKDAKTWGYNPFVYAFRLLGGAGWELVSHQFASGAVGGGGGSVYAFFEWDRRVAVFKRPVQKDMPVDEPKLIDLVKP